MFSSISKRDGATEKVLGSTSGTDREGESRKLAYTKLREFVSARFPERKRAILQGQDAAKSGGLF